MSAKELFTIVKHEPRVKYGLSYVDYCLADTIYHLANNENNKLDGWCYKSKENLAIQLGVSRSTIQTSILKLIANKWVIKNQYGHLRTTKKWEDSVIHSKVTGQSVKKLHTKKTDLRTSDCVKTTPYNYSEKDNDKGFTPEKLIPSSTNKVERESTMVLQSVKDIFHAEYQSYPTIGAKEKAAAKRAIKELGVKDTLLLVEEWFDSSKVHPDIKPQIMAIFSTNSINKWKAMLL